MNYYLVIGHACDEESEWQFTNSDKELTNDFLEEKFTQSSLELATRLLYANSTVITDVNCLVIINFVI